MRFVFNEKKAAQAGIVRFWTGYAFGLVGTALAVCGKGVHYDGLRPGRDRRREGCAMTTALEVARALIHVAAGDEEALDPLRLQKLLYYVQGWNLAMRGRPMFSDRFEAWAHGPAVPSVWRHFKHQGWMPISPGTIPPSKISDADLDMVTRVWNTYKGFSGIHLKKMTHNEAPWMTARGDLPEEAKSNAEITHDSMREYFTACLNKRGG